MNQSTSPLSEHQLFTKEETLKDKKQKRELFIGIPKENQYQEKRICLTPDAVNTIVAHGHQVLIESKAGEIASFSDIDYTNAGAEITENTKKVFSCPLLLKATPPTISEIKMIKPQTTIISALQIKTQSKEYFEKLAKKRITAIAFEYIQDEDGKYPTVHSLNEIVGVSSVLIASEIMGNSNKGNGLMFGNISGVPPTEVVIIGAGTVGVFAARSAIGLGANIKVFDSSISKLQKIQINLNRSFYTSTIQPKNLLKALKRCDVAIGAAEKKDRSPIVVSSTMVKNMKKGAIIIDTNINAGGCFETSKITSRDTPTFENFGVIHYAVPNISSHYPKTVSISISNIFTPFLLKIGEDGGLEMALRFDKGLRKGLYMYHGILTNKYIGECFSFSYSDINFLIF